MFLLFAPRVRIILIFIFVMPVYANMIVIIIIYYQVCVNGFSRNTEFICSIMLWTEIIAFGFFYALMSYFPWRRWFIRPQEMEECVYDAAFREFYSSGLYKTRESNGVLIYLSGLERRVVVLGDKGIHEKMGEQHWHEVRDMIIHGIKEGKTKEGICAAVMSCGAALAKNFPRLSDDTNELPNHVIDRTKQ